MQKQKGIPTLVGIIIIIVVAVILFGGVFTYQYFTKSQTAGLPVQSPQATEGWKTYKNDVYGFEIRYPVEWEANDNNPSAIYKSQVVISNTNPESKIDWTIGEISDYSGDIEIEIVCDSGNSFYENAKKYLKTFDYRQIAGQEVIHSIHDVSISTEQGGTGTYIEYDFSKNDQSCQAKIYYNKKSGGVGEKMISTFKFTK